MTGSSRIACGAVVPGLVSACTPQTPPAPAQAVCDALRPALPTMAPGGYRAQSKHEAVRFLDVWNAVCGNRTR